MSQRLAPVNTRFIAMVHDTHREVRAKEDLHTSLNKRARALDEATSIMYGTDADECVEATDPKRDGTSGLADERCVFHGCYRFVDAAKK